MKAGESSIEVGTLVAPINITGNDKVLNGLICEATHPFATGCTDNGWVGLRSNEYTAYGYHFNCEEKELIVFNSEQIKVIEELKQTNKTDKIYYTGTKQTNLSSFKIKKCYKDKKYNRNLLEHITIEFL